MNLADTVSTALHLMSFTASAHFVQRRIRICPGITHAASLVKQTIPFFITILLYESFSPNHLVDNACVALDNFHHFRANIFLNIIGHGDSIIRMNIHIHSRCYCLEQAFFVDACEDEARLIQSFGAFRTCPDTYRRERMPHRSKETAFLGKCSAVRNNGKCIHLKAVVIVETQRLWRQ